MRVRGVVFDVGNVIVRWDPRTLYSKIHPDVAERDWFLANVCTMAWHTAHDAGVSFAANRAPLPIQGTGEQTRSMTYVDDAIELLLLVADRRQPMLQPINIGSDDERSVNEIARLLAHVLQVEFTPEYSAGRPGDPQRRRPDLRRARALGWQAATSLEDGLRLTYDWFSRESGLFV